MESTPTNFPAPDKVLTNNDEVRQHIEDLVFNTMAWLKIDGYDFVVYLPGETGHKEYADAGASVSVEHPYKKFKISLQIDSLQKCLSEQLSSAFWSNLEEGIFHECIHVILWRLNHIARKRWANSEELEEEDEHITDHLTHVLHSLCVNLRKYEKNKT